MRCAGLAPGVRGAGVWDAAIAHTGTRRPVLLTKLFQFACKVFLPTLCLKVNWLWAALTVGHQVPLSPLAFRGSSVSVPSAHRGTALPCNTEKISEAKLPPKSEEREIFVIFVSVLAGEANFSASFVLLSVTAGKCAEKVYKFIMPGRVEF